MPAGNNPNRLTKHFSTLTTQQLERCLWHSSHFYFIFMPKVRYTPKTRWNKGIRMTSLTSFCWLNQILNFEHILHFFWCLYCWLWANKCLLGYCTSVFNVHFEYFLVGKKNSLQTSSWWQCCPKGSAPNVVPAYQKSTRLLLLLG